jgi:hypothetical protein
MLVSRFISYIWGDEQSWADRHHPAANTNAVITRAAVPGKRSALTKLVWSYSADPTATATLVVSHGGSVLLRIYILKGGPGSLNFQGRLCQGNENTDLTITLAAGGSGITGTLGAEGLL